MATKKYLVRLTEVERDTLTALISTGQAKVRKVTRARILLKADDGWTDEAISEALDVGLATVQRIRKRFAEVGIEAVERRSSRRTYERKFDGELEAHLIALACSTPPDGRAEWSLRLLAERFVELEHVDVESVSYETVRRVLKKTNCNLGAKNNG